MKLQTLSDKSLVLCVGNTYMELINYTPTYPEEEFDERVLNGYWQRSGRASIICTLLRSLGIDCEFFGRLSTSELNYMLMDDMRKNDIVYDHCPKISLVSPFTTVILTRDKRTRTVIQCNLEFPYVTSKEFECLELKNYGWIHFEAHCSKETILMIRAVQDYNNDKLNKIIISLQIELNLQDYVDMAQMCDYVFLEQKASIQQGWQSPEEACFGLKNLMRIPAGINVNRPNIISIWDKLGVGCLNNQEEFTILHAHMPKNTVNYLHQQSVFIGSFIYANYIREQKLPDAVNFANLTTASKMKQLGFDDMDRGIQL